MGVLNLTPDSFSDGGKYNKKKLGEQQAKKLIKDGCGILDLGGEATNPGSKDVNEDKEWERIVPTLSRIKRLKKFISLDTRKSSIMKKGIKNKINLINDVSGLEYDQDTIQVLRKLTFHLYYIICKGTKNNAKKSTIQQCLIRYL